MDDKNVVKKRVTLAIAFAVFIVVVIAVILPTKVCAVNVVIKKTVGLIFIHNRFYVRTVTAWIISSAFKPYHIENTITCT